MKRKLEFAVELIKQVMESVYRSPEQNMDCDRFGYPPRSSRRARVRRRIEGLLWSLSRMKRMPVLEQVDHDLIRRVEDVGEELEGLAEVYDLLGDDSSRSLLVKLMTYRILGNKRVSLPLNNNCYWKRREYMKSLFDPADCIPLDFNHWTLNKVDLASVGYPIKLYSIALGIQPIFDLKQYEYHKCTPAIKAQEGEVVIDAGGCWGDTALYFANEVGINGRVHTFEFIPANLAVMMRNLDLNPDLRKRVSIVERPLWGRSDEILYCKDNGPGSRVSLDRIDDTAMAIKTVSIDDFVSQNSIDRVDFIKMDIEGAELSALEGAARVICTSKPKLAISVYHRLSDFVSIPKFLSSLGLGYRFYLGHYTIHSEETVLFAAPQ